MAATLLVLASLCNAVGENWLFLWLGAAVEAALLLLVVPCAWTWPRKLDRSTAPTDVAASPG